MKNKLADRLRAVSCGTRFLPVASPTASLTNSCAKSRVSPFQFLLAQPIEFFVRTVLVGAVAALALPALSASETEPPLPAVPAAAAPQEAPTFSQAELDQMLAPIALFPDALLAQVLVASTYPLEVVAAARWSAAHPDLEGQAAVKAVADKHWDPSVKSLVAFPTVLARMDQDLDWLNRLGNAFLLQEEQVTATIQRLRHKADAAGSLTSLDRVRVHREREVIYIEPASPRVIYVPYYHSTVIYGDWWWPAYPPVYWYSPVGYYRSSVVVWTRGVPISSGIFYSTFDWHRRHVVVVNVHHIYPPRITHSAYRHGHSDYRRWHHDAGPRRGTDPRAGLTDRHTQRHGSTYRSDPSSLRTAESDRIARVRPAPETGRPEPSTHYWTRREDSGFSRADGERQRVRVVPPPVLHAPPVPETTPPQRTVEAPPAPPARQRVSTASTPSARPSWTRDENRSFSDRSPRDSSPPPQVVPSSPPTSNPRQFERPSTPPPPPPVANRSASFPARDHRQAAPVPAPQPRQPTAATPSSDQSRQQPTARSRSQESDVPENHNRSGFSRR
jgi:hypothetical protein